MTRQITFEACQAFESGRKFCKSNTLVTSDGKMYLFGNKIAEYVDGKLRVSLCGWNSNTTRERLNGLTGVSVCTRNYQPYLNGEPISSYATYEVVAGQPIKEV